MEGGWRQGESHTGNIITSISGGSVLCMRTVDVRGHSMGCVLVMTLFTTRFNSRFMPGAPSRSTPQMHSSKSTSGGASSP